MPKYYGDETNRAASRVFSALITSAHKAIKDGSQSRAARLINIASALEVEFDITEEPDPGS